MVACLMPVNQMFQNLKLQSNSQQFVYCAEICLAHTTSVLKTHHHWDKLPIKLTK